MVLDERRNLAIARSEKRGDEVAVLLDDLDPTFPIEDLAAEDHPDMAGQPLPHR